MKKEMTLEEKITNNESILKQLIVKKENLERQISNLEHKIENQKFAQSHPPKEKKGDKK